MSTQGKWEFIEDTDWVDRLEQSGWIVARCTVHIDQGVRHRYDRPYAFYDVTTSTGEGRARYWPHANPTALSIPVSTNCHHSIRRVRD